MALIFKFLCGILYAIGLCFGLTYKEISVDICIYLCPILCIIAALLSILTGSNRNFKTRFLLSMNIGLCVSYIKITSMFWKHYAVYDPFTLCMNDLIKIANKMNMTYEEVNIYLYCYVFFGILLFHLIQVFINHRLKRSKTNEKSICNIDSDVNNQCQCICTEDEKCKECEIK